MFNFSFNFSFSFNFHAYAHVSMLVLFSMSVLNWVVLTRAFWLSPLRMQVSRSIGVRAGMEIILSLGVDVFLYYFYLIN